MGRTAVLRVGFQQQHLTPRPSAERCAAETTDAAADDNNVNLVLHPVTPDPAIIVVAAPLEWPPAG